MTDQSEPETATDGGLADGKFEEVDWQDVDSTEYTRSLKSKLWAAVLGIWALGLGANLFVRYVMADDLFHEIAGVSIPGIAALDPTWIDAIPGLAVADGWIQFPVLGVVALHDWLWSITLAGIAYYAVVPLYEKPRMRRYYWRQFRKNKAAVISGIFLVVVFLVGVVGSRVTDQPTEQAGLDNIPPVGISIESFVVGPNGQDVADCSGGTCTGTWEYPLGTTTSGEDILISVIHGMEISMMIGLTATALSTVIAATLALSAVYYGGWVDEIIFRWVDIQLTFPAFFLYLLIVYSVGGSLFILIMVFGFIEWGGGARLMRSEALQRREEPYITASKAAGASPLWTIRQHLLPNISNTIITYVSLSIPSIILAEAALAFLGLGDATVTSWGQIINDGQSELSRAWWISTVPGIFLFLTVLAFNFVGDALRDAIDPRHAGAK